MGREERSIWSYQLPEYIPIPESNMPVMFSTITGAGRSDQDDNVVRITSGNEADIITAIQASSGTGTFQFDGEDLYYTISGVSATIPTDFFVSPNFTITHLPGTPFSIRIFPNEDLQVLDPGFKYCDICGRVWPVRMMKRNENDDSYLLVCPNDYDKIGRAHV